MRLLKVLFYFFILIIVSVGLIHFFRPDLDARGRILLSAYGYVPEIEPTKFIPNIDNTSFFFSTSTISKTTVKKVQDIISMYVNQSKNSENWKKLTERTLKSIQDNSHSSISLEQNKSDEDKKLKRVIDNIQDLSRVAKVYSGFYLDENITDLKNMDFFVVLNSYFSLNLKEALFSSEKAKLIFIEQIQNYLDQRNGTFKELVLGNLNTIQVKQFFTKGFPLYKVIIPGLDNFSIFVTAVGKDSVILASSLELIEKMIDRSTTSTGVNQKIHLSRTQKNNIYFNLNTKRILNLLNKDMPFLDLILKNLENLYLSLKLNNKIEGDIFLEFENDNELELVKNQVERYHLNLESDSIERILFPNIDSKLSQLILSWNLDLDDLQRKINKKMELIVNHSINEYQRISYIHKIVNDNKLTAISLHPMDAPVGENRTLKILNKKDDISFNLPFIFKGTNSFSDLTYTPKFLILSGFCSESKARFYLTTKTKNIDESISIKPMSSVSIFENGSAYIPTDQRNYMLFSINRNTPVSNIDLHLLGTSSSPSQYCVFNNTPFILSK